jgi:deoxyribodipyrimidine photo-lyase
MNKQYHTSLFIFHRDLRLQDNTAILAALAASDEVILSFIFDERQVDRSKNTYHSEAAVQFMLESLEDIEAQLNTKGTGKLSYFYGITNDVVEKLITAEQIDAVYSNYDYTPFAKARDEAIASVCASANIPFHQYHDALLQPPGTVLKDNGDPYTVYTPFAKKSMLQFPVRTYETNIHTHYSTKEIRGSIDRDTIFEQILPTRRNTLKVRGGRTEARKILTDIADFVNYKTERDILALDATTHLSAHNKFGTVSVREVYATVKTAFGLEHRLIAELYWRDFFTHIAYHFPNVFGHNFNSTFDAVEWDENNEIFEHWCNGTTGFPIVDAGMRELNQTGYMHNRARMIVASFLTKDLHIHWLRGEQYFASKLIDYDPAVNNGGWQWAASTGCDAQPYFRIFNPWLQQKKFDPQAEYIKKWVPELTTIPAAVIHNWHVRHSELPDVNYPSPIIDHDTERKETLRRFKQT